MNNFKQLAILTGEVEESYQTRFIEGAMKTAFAAGYEVTVFSMFQKYQSSKERDIGDSSVFQLVNYDKFDAIIFMGDSIQTPHLSKKLEEQIHNRFHGPVVAVDYKSDYFYSFSTDGYLTFYGLVTHLIEEHGFKDIACLTGKKYHEHSKKRLQAYRDAMAAHNLPVREKRVAYGDFWYTSGASFGETLLRDRDDLPEAIVCANDCMAIGLCETLTQAGLKIPEDIAVAGFDATDEGKYAPVPLTSAHVSADYYGTYAVQCILNIVNGEEQKMPVYVPRISIGGTCGCTPEKDDYQTKLRSYWTNRNREKNISSTYTTMMSDLMFAGDRMELLRGIYNKLPYLKDVVTYDLCLNSDASVGFSDQMISAVSYRAMNKASSYVSESNTFAREEIFPYRESGDKPMGYIVSPIFFNERTYGYEIISFGSEARVYDANYPSWSGIVCCALESLRREREYRVLQDLQKRKTAVTASQGSNLDDMTEEQKVEMKEVERILDENQFNYAFQPIVSVETGEIYSYEALMRPKTDHKLSPLDIIRMAKYLGREYDIEKSTILNVLGIVDERQDIFKDKKVFINSMPGNILTHEDLDKAKTYIRRNVGRVVIELTESGELDNETLTRVKNGFVAESIEMAIDDYGTGYSNIANLLRYMPRYVKIDRALLSGIQDDEQKQHFVREIIEFCHENDIMALAEGVETAEELHTVILFGADLIQGFYTARPSIDIVTSIDEKIKQEIHSYYKESINGEALMTYVAGSSARIDLAEVAKHRQNIISFQGQNSIYRDVTLAGVPGEDTNIHVEITDKYEGTITLENVSLFNKHGRPAISVDRNCNVTFNLIGENNLVGGIYVPKGAKVAFEGEGNLNLDIDCIDYFGIGAAPNETAGFLEFYQNGGITINAKGRDGVMIGGGAAEKIEVIRGKFTLKSNGHIGVGIGTIQDEVELNLHDCDIDISVTGRYACCIGSMKDSANINISNAYVKSFYSGMEAVAIGSVRGEHANVDIHDACMVANARTGTSTVIGSIEGNTVSYIKSVSLHTSSMGSDIWLFGGADKDKIDAVLDDADLYLQYNSEKESVEDIIRDNFRIESTRYDVVINGKKTEFDCQ